MGLSRRLLAGASLKMVEDKYGIPKGEILDFENSPDIINLTKKFEEAKYDGTDTLEKEYYNSIDALAKSYSLCKTRFNRRQKIKKIISEISMLIRRFKKKILIIVSTIGSGYAVYYFRDILLDVIGSGIWDWIKSLTK